MFVEVCVMHLQSIPKNGGMNIADIELFKQFILMISDSVNCKIFGNYSVPHPKFCCPVSTAILISFSLRNVDADFMQFCAKIS